MGEAQLRALSALPENRHCFECGQRGPTYVDVTVGSFVCSRCSGLLRGLQPPHRVKSISMATFGDEEVAHVRRHGNERCRRVWLATYEGVPPAAGARGDDVLDFLRDKYEKKAYYHDAQQSQQPLQQQRQQQPALSPPPPAKSSPLHRSQPQPLPRTEPQTQPPLPPKHRPVPPPIADPFEPAPFRADFASADIFDSTPFASSSSSSSSSAAAFDRLNANFVPASTPPDRYAALADLDSTFRQLQRDDTFQTQSSAINPFDPFVTIENPNNPFRMDIDAQHNNNNNNARSPFSNGNPSNSFNPFAFGDGAFSPKSKNPFL